MCAHPSAIDSKINKIENVAIFYLYTNICYNRIEEEA